VTGEVSWEDRVHRMRPGAYLVCRASDALHVDYIVFIPPRASDISRCEGQDDPGSRAFTVTVPLIPPASTKDGAWRNAFDVLDSLK